MTPKRTSVAKSPAVPLRVVVVTMDTHLASATERARGALRRELPGLQLSMHAASEWAADNSAFERCKAAITEGDIVIVTMLFMEDHFLPLLPVLQARREHCDAMVCHPSLRCCAMRRRRIRFYARVMPRILVRCASRRISSEKTLGCHQAVIWMIYTLLQQQETAHDSIQIPRYEMRC